MSSDTPLSEYSDFCEIDAVGLKVVVALTDTITDRRGWNLVDDDDLHRTSFMNVINRMMHQNVFYTNMYQGGFQSRSAKRT